jgi:hypothetical protein
MLDEQAIYTESVWSVKEMRRIFLIKTIFLLALQKL